MKAKEGVSHCFTDINFKFFEQIPGAWGCKDKNSVIIYANHDYSKLAGLKHPKEMVGRTDFDMPYETVNCAKLFRAQDKKVMEAGKPIRILDIHPFPNLLWKAYLVTKAPLQNNKGQIIGTIFHAENITNIHTIEIGSFLADLSTANNNHKLVIKEDYFMNDSSCPIKLTKRQSEVLFFLLRGKTLKQMAKILNISYRTIDEYLKELKCKFNANNKYELIDKAIHYGFLNTIPESLFNVQLSMEIKL